MAGTRSWGCKEVTRKRRRRAKASQPGFSDWIKARGRAFAHAGRGVCIALKTQPHFQIHTLATIAVVALGFSLGVTAGEWIVLLLCIGSVLAAEAFNSAIESLADALSTKHHPLIGRAKDIAAGAVLILAAMSAIIGTLIFWPKIFT